MLALVKQYHSFIVDSPSFDPNTGTIELRYGFDDEVKFTETIQLPQSYQRSATDSRLQQALQMLHLLGGVSYYKACCPEKIVVQSGELSKAQADFFQTVYENGLGEFAYKNKMNLWGNIQFPYGKNAQPNTLRKPNKPAKPTFLIPIGGGKDSIVTIEKLRAQDKDITLFRMGKHPLIDALVEAMHLPCITVKRSIAPELLKLNAEGARNGHVPITAYLSALAVVVAEICGFDAVVMSNERSASEGNVEHFGRMINHQWSKSAEAEEMIRAYIHTFVDPNLRYKNPLREMTELEIAKEAATYPQYFEIFSSCNKNWKIVRSERTGKPANPRTRWCGACPKCAFAFLLFAAHLPKADVLRIFGSNFLESKDLLTTFRQLLGIEGSKPFECVGTPEETRDAIAMIRMRGEFNDTIVLQSLDDVA